MKNFSRTGTLLLLCLLMGCLPTFAQKSGPFVGGNLVLGFPLGDFKEGYKSALGLEGTLGGGTKNIKFLITTGYTSYKNQEGNRFGKIRLIPLKAGLRIYATRRIFLTGNAGAGFLKDERMSAYQSRFVYDAGIGYHGAVGQLGFHYDGWKRKNNSGTTNTFQIKLGLALR